MSQALYDLPVGWEWVKLENIFDTKGFSVGKIPKTEFGNEGSIPIIDQSQNFIAGYTETDDFYVGMLPVVVYGDHTNNLKYVDFKFICGADGTKVLVPKKTVSARYSYYLLERFKPETQGYRRHFPILKTVKFPLPPLAEQTRIVEKLDAVLSRIDTAIDELQQSLALVDAIFKSGLDGVFEEVYAHSEVRKLSELTTKIGSGATPKGGESAYKEIGISLIRSLNVHDINFKCDGLAFIDDEQAKALSNVEVASGDVLLNITGASIARCCIVPDAILPARVNQHVCILRPNHLLNREFLNYLIVSPKFKLALLFQGAGGATRQALTKAMIENFDIPVPTLKKQTEAIEKIKQINEQTTQLKTEINAKIGMFNQLKASVLDGAFRGEIIKRIMS